VLSLGLTVGLRAAIQFRRTGSIGIHRFRGRPGSAEWWVGLVFLTCLALVPLSLLLALFGVLDPIDALDRPVFQIAGIVLVCVGMLLVFGAQLAMGDSWRIGVEEEERTDLVTDGIFAVVRNPIYSAVMPAGVGFALMVPNVLSIVAAALVVVALEVLVRALEEPYLLRTHGEAYRDYASRVGRFLPGVGLLGAPRRGSVSPQSRS
jgi:protein-S-isoprenylcysteine O-methyltransferase Ste14